MYGLKARMANTKVHVLNHRAVPHPNDEETLALLSRGGLLLRISTKVYKKPLL